MKKTIALLMVCLLILPIALAAGPSAGNANSGSEQAAGNQEETNEQNQGEEEQIQNKVRDGNYTSSDGKNLQIQEKSNSKLQLKSGNTSADTSMEMTQEETKLMVKLSNGKKSEVKVMPDTSSERAIERLRLKVCSEENSCTIQLKEVGQGNETKAAYEVKAQKQVKVLGLFKAKMQVQAQVDAENGEVIQTKKPWWSFLASE